jgi:hypothetical protein
LKGSSKRRLINDLKAALNAAYLDNRTSLSNDFPAIIQLGLKAIFAGDPDEQVARVNQVLDDEQVRSLVRMAAEIDADGDLGRLVLALAATGAPFSRKSPGCSSRRRSAQALAHARHGGVPCEIRKVAPPDRPRRRCRRDRCQPACRTRRVLCASLCGLLIRRFSALAAG